MRLAVHVLDRLAAGALGEAEDRRLVGVEPVGVVAHVVLVLRGEVELVRVGDGLRGRPRHVVAVEEQRHASERIPRRARDVVRAPADHARDGSLRDSSSRRDHVRFGHLGGTPGR